MLKNKLFTISLSKFFKKSVSTNQSESFFSRNSARQSWNIIRDEHRKSTGAMSLDQMTGTKWSSILLEKTLKPGQKSISIIIASSPRRLK